MNHKTIKINYLHSVAWIIALLLAGCSRDPNQQKYAYLASGDNYYQRSKYQEAVIQFRNAIQIDPDLPRPTGIWRAPT